ncbi:MAG: hypothetical protein AABP62_31625 [Planctomycetota bacterium]
MIEGTVSILTVLALLGTGGVFGSWLNELRRARREDKLRWHVERRGSYERFLTSIDNLREAELDTAQHVSTLRALTNWGNDPLFDLEDLLRQADALDDSSAKYAVSKVRAQQNAVADANDQIAASLAAMEMLATPAVVQAGGVTRNMLFTLVTTAYEYPPRHCGGWSEPLVQASKGLSDARTAFVSAVRKELGVK